MIYNFPRDSYIIRGESILILSINKLIIELTHFSLSWPPTPSSRIIMPCVGDLCRHVHLMSACAPYVATCVLCQHLCRMSVRVLETENIHGLFWLGCIQSLSPCPVSSPITPSFHTLCMVCGERWREGGMNKGTVSLWYHNEFWSGWQIENRYFNIFKCLFSTHKYSTTPLIWTSTGSISGRSGFWMTWYETPTHPKTKIELTNQHSGR